MKLMKPLRSSRWPLRPSKMPTRTRASKKLLLVPLLPSPSSNNLNKPSQFVKPLTQNKWTGLSLIRLLLHLRTTQSNSERSMVLPDLFSRCNKWLSQSTVEIRLINYRTQMFCIHKKVFNLFIMDLESI